MLRQVKKWIAVGVLFSLCAGCVTTGTTPGAGSASTNSDDATQTKADDATQTKAEGAGLGALAGALIGGFLGKQLGGNSGLFAGAAAGALLGGGAGYLAGSKVAERKQHYASEEARLDGEISVATQYNKDLAIYNAQTRDRIKTFNHEAADLSSRYKAGKITADKLHNKRNEIQTTLNDSEKMKDRMNEELVGLNGYLASLQKVPKGKPQGKEAQLRQEIATLKANIATLDNNNMQLAKALTTTFSVSK